MARARMLAASISTDDRVRALSCTTARLLFTWMIAHADNLGRLRGEPSYVGSLVLPYESADPAEIQAYLAEMHQIGLIVCYEVNGAPFIQLNGWRKHQDLTKYGKRSDYPGPPESPPENRRGAPENRLGSEVEVKRSEEKRSEEEEKCRGETKPANVDSVENSARSQPPPDGGLGPVSPKGKSLKLVPDRGAVPPADENYFAGKR